MKCLDYMKYLKIPEECWISYFQNLMKSQKKTGFYLANSQHSQY